MKFCVPVARRGIVGGAGLADRPRVIYSTAWRTGRCTIPSRLDRVVRERLERLPPGLQPRLSKDARIVLIDNPASGSGTFAQHAEHSRQLYAFLGYDVQLWRTERPGHATELAMRAAEEGIDLVVVCGGDGAVRETVQGLLRVDAEVRPKMSLVPKGTANILAKTLGLQVGPFPDFIHACFKQLYWARSRPMDVGSLNGEAFACFAGFGFDAAVIESVTAEQKRRYKEFAFFATAMQKLFKWNPRQLRFETYEAPELRVRGHDRDGRAVDVRGYFVCAGNVRDYGTRLFPFMQNARVDDGLLDVIVVQTRDMLELLNIGTQVLARTHLRNPHITAFQTGRDILVEALDAPVPMHVDAELLERGTRSHIRVHPAALNVVY